MRVSLCHSKIKEKLCVRKANEKEKCFMEIMTIFHVTLCRLSAAVLQFFQHFLLVSVWNSSREDATRNKSRRSERKKEKETHS